MWRQSAVRLGVNKLLERPGSAGRHNDHAHDYQADIRPLFTQRDIHAMLKAFDPARYDDVKAHAAVIFDRLRGIGGAVMPPPPPRGEGQWPQSQIDLFGKWMADGCPP